MGYITKEFRKCIVETCQQEPVVCNNVAILAKIILNWNKQDFERFVVDLLYSSRVLGLIILAIYGLCTGIL